MSILSIIEADLKLVWTYFTQIVTAVFSTVENQLMVDATNIMKAEAIAIQNAQPGISTKAFIDLLVTNAKPQLTGALQSLGVAALTTVASTIAKDLRINDTGGNAGVVTSSTTT